MTITQKYKYLQDSLNGAGAFVDQMFNENIITQENKDKIDKICNNCNYMDSNWILAVSIMYDIVHKHDNRR